MDNRGIAAVILAAGKGKRMRSDLPKVLHELKGRPLIQWVVDAARKAGANEIVAVVGHGADRVKDALEGQPVRFALQERQLGTAHAVAQAEDGLAGFNGDVFVLCGDVPLTSPDTLKTMLEQHREEGNALTLLSVEMDDPSGYGRILRDGAGNVTANVEDKDADEEQKKVKEINGGIYLFNAAFLFPALKKVGNDNNQGEYYLPDLIAIAIGEGRRVGALKLENNLELCGVNRPEDLQALEQALAGTGETGCRA